MTPGELALLLTGVGVVLLIAEAVLADARRAGHPRA
jgi:hypothetical protein